MLIALGLHTYVTGSNPALTPGCEFYLLLSEIQLTTLCKQPSGCVFQPIGVNKAMSAMLFAVIFPQAQRACTFDLSADRSGWLQLALRSSAILWKQVSLRSSAIIWKPAFISTHDNGARTSDQMTCDAWRPSY